MKLRSPWAAAVQSLGWAGEGSTVQELLTPALVPPQSPHMLGEQGCPTGAAKGKRCIWKMKKSCLSSLQRMGDCCQQTQALKKKGLRHLTRGSADPGHPWSSGCCCTPLLLAALSFLCCSHKDPTQPGCFLRSPLVSFEAKKSVNTSTTQPCSHLTADQYTKPAGEGSLLLSLLKRIASPSLQPGGGGWWLSAGSQHRYGQGNKCRWATGHFHQLNWAVPRVRS